MGIARNILNRFLKYCIIPNSPGGIQKKSCHGNTAPAQDNETPIAIQTRYIVCVCNSLVVKNAGKK